MSWHGKTILSQYLQKYLTLYIKKIFLCFLRNNGEVLWQWVWCHRDDTWRHGKQSFRRSYPSSIEITVQLRLAWAIPYFLQWCHGRNNATESTLPPKHKSREMSARAQPRAGPAFPWWRGTRHSAQAIKMRHSVPRSVLRLKTIRHRKKLGLPYVIGTK